MKAKRRGLLKHSNNTYNISISILYFSSNFLFLSVINPAANDTR